MSDFCEQEKTEEKAFSEVLTVSLIQRKYMQGYPRKILLETLLSLEQEGLTLSDVKKHSGVLEFYFNNFVKKYLLKEFNKKGIKKKNTFRVRYSVPTYEKFYSIWQYDRSKFRELLNEWLKSDEGKNRTLDSLRKKQAEILEECWILDENNNKKRDCDEPHIFRYQTLQKILECIAYTLINNYNIQNIDSVKYLLKRTNIMIYKPIEGLKPQAEILHTILDDIKTRILIHLRLLKYLKKGYEIEDAVTAATI